MQYFDLVAMTLTFTVLVRPVIYALQRNNYRLFTIVNLLLTPYYAILLLMQIVMFAVVISPLAYQSAILAVGCVLLTYVANRGKKKVPLRYTPRVVRLFIVCLVLIFGTLWHIPSYIVPMFLPLIVLIACVVILPIEKLIFCYYWKKANKKLQSTNAIKIAVTGSYGKTSVKFILAHLLEGIATPSSYNTPMGIAKFVNSTALDQYSYVVLEMGARHPHDISKLCKLVQPDVGVVVGVAPQHIQTLGGMAGVIAVKQELLHSMANTGGLVILNGGCDTVSSWTDVADVSTVVSSDIVSCSVDSISYNSMTLNISYLGNEYTVTTALVGLANLDNIALCLSVALRLGMDIEVLLYRLSNIEQIAHRMQSIEGAVHIIDDSYNANIKGIKMCCDTVSAMTNVSNKVVIAQGIVEGGAMSDQLNYQVGQMLGECFDQIVLTGVNASTIASGVGKGKCVHITDNIDDAVKCASKYYTDDTLVVFSNDIP